MMDVIAMASASRDQQWGMAASWALFRGIVLQEILVAASWGSLDTFVIFYRLEVIRSSLEYLILMVGSNAATWCSKGNSVV